MMTDQSNVLAVQHLAALMTSVADAEHRDGDWNTILGDVIDGRPAMESLLLLGDMLGAACGLITTLAAASPEAAASVERFRLRAAAL